MPATLTMPAAVQPVAEPVPDAPPASRGTVKWFNDPKGFGFILDADGNDVFVHYAVIDGDGFKTLDEGEAVLYDSESGPKGNRATRVVRL